MEIDGRAPTRTDAGAPRDRSRVVGIVIPPPPNPGAASRSAESSVGAGLVPAPLRDRSGARGQAPRLPERREARPPDGGDPIRPERSQRGAVPDPPDHARSIAREDSALLAALQSAFDFHSLNVRCEVWPGDPADLPAILDRCRDERCLGVVLPPELGALVATRLDFFDDRLPAEATDVVVREVRRRRVKLVGCAAGGTGFLAALRERASYEPSGKRAVLLAAGPFARQISQALAAAEVESLVVWDAVPERAVELAAAVRTVAPELAPIAVRYDALGPALAASDLVVGFGGWPAGDETGLSAAGVDAEFRLPERGMVCDFELGGDSPLRRAAAAADCQVLDGLILLVFRAAAAFEHLCEQRAPLGLMLARARETSKGID